MVAANDGNFSVKLNDHEFLCTPTGVSKGFMTPEYICKVDDKGNVLQANKGFKPSSEIKMHMRVYQKRPDVSLLYMLIQCMQHHSLSLVFRLHSQSCQRQLSLLDAFRSLSTVHLLQWRFRTTLRNTFHHFDAVLLENHGALAYSDSLLSAYHKMESLEFYAQSVMAVHADW